MNPNIFNRVKNAVQAFTESKQTNSMTNDAADFLRFGPRHKPMLQEWSQVEMSDQDMYTGYPYAVIKKRANRTAALGKRFLYTEASKPMMEAAKKQEKELEHPYLELIRKSKEFTTRRFWHDISTYLDLEGVYYLMAVRAVSTSPNGDVKVGAVQKFSMLNPYNIRKVIRESDGTIGGYIETKNGLYREIPREMIIEIRLLNPFDNDLAFSMTDAAKESQFTMKQAGDYTRHSINGNINAPGAITTEVQLDDNIFDNFVSRIQNHTKGEPLYGNGSGAVHWESMQIDLDKAALDKITDIHKATLFSVGGVNSMLMGEQKSGTGREVSKTQKDDFTENAIMPQVEDITDALNLDYRKWYPEWEKNEFEILLDNPLETDREAELKDIEIRQEELTLRDNLIAKGYEYNLANKYAHGDISLEELGEPTLEPQKTPEELAFESAQAIAQVKATPKSPAEPKDTPDNKRANTQTKADDETKSATAKKVPKENVTNFFKKAVNQVAARDLPDLYEDLEIDVRAVNDDKYRGCIMMNTEKIPVTQYVKKGEDDLVHSTDRHDHTMGAVSEVEPHTTLFYGLLNNGHTWKKKVNQVLDGWSMDTVKIDKVSFFELPDSYAVVALLEATDEIVDGHGRLSLLPAVNTFSEYHPHITLAYITKDSDIDKWVTALGKKYDGQIVSTKGLNYGDKPEKKSTKNHVEDEHDMSKNKKVCICCHGFGEHKTGFECYGCDASGIQEEFTGPFPCDGHEDSPDVWVDEEGHYRHKEEQKNTASVTRVEASHSHDDHNHDNVTNSTLNKALNELDPALKDQVLLQEADLQRAVARLENDVAQAVIEALRAGNVNEAEELISEAQEENFIAELAVIIAAYYLVLFPIYAAQLLAFRLATFGSQGVFAMTEEVETYIRQAARRAAESHIQTIITDFSRTVTEATDGVTHDELLKIVQDKVNARDPDYMKLLPENPNNEDVIKAVDAGKFDNHPAFKLARDLARQGLGLQEIERSIQSTFTKMSETRAKTIARHEASRVFNMSQYQADLQFLTESNNLPNAYKRLRSRTGDPCAVCAQLIEKTRLKPIPFTENFADLGETLTANYKRPSGKMAVQKIPVNYEPIAAGNVHVNCNCEYELIIKNDDGTTLNDIDVRTHNQVSYKDPIQKAEAEDQKVKTAIIESEGK
jgi:portal protein